VGSEPVSVSEFEGVVVGVDIEGEARGFARGMLDMTRSWERGRKPFGRGGLVEEGGDGCCVMVSEEH
jgi:glycerate-2-kinase